MATPVRKFGQAGFQASLYNSRKSLTFNGTDDLMAMFSGFGANTFPIRRSQKTSIGMWIRYQGPADPSVEQHTLITRWFPTPSFAINEGGHRMYIFSGSASGNPAVTRALWVHLSTNIFSGVWIYTKASFPLDEWVHVCMTWDGFVSGGVAGLKVYWNGVEQDRWIVINTWASEAINSSAFTHLLWGVQYTHWHPLGGLPSADPELVWWFEGLMDETTLWRVELSATEVLRLYNCGKPVSPKNIGLPSKPIDTHFRMGEFTDGSPFLLGFSICFGRYPVGAPFRNAFWNNDQMTPPVRVSADVSS